MPKLKASEAFSIWVNFIDFEIGLGVLDFDSEMFIKVVDFGGGRDDRDFDGIWEDFSSFLEFMKRGVFILKSSEYSLSNKPLE